MTCDFHSFRLNLLQAPGLKCAVERKSRRPSNYHPPARVLQRRLFSCVPTAHTRLGHLEPYCCSFRFVIHKIAIQASGDKFNELLSSIPYTKTATMAAKVLYLDELPTLIVTHLVTISPRNTVALTQTCQAPEVPALGVLWEIQSSIKLLIQSVMPVNAYCYIYHAKTEPLQIVGHLFSFLWMCYAQSSRNLPTFRVARVGPVTK